ncbi:MAG: class III poly(R)-hydroxyalkanoic acid synthase subunit PhaC [Syntrophobacterales bacterium]|nr:class III poly(R)-hydroxyalkanoic acid synthase subunit PhaC [Syntrophobacterales bacterium]
MSEPKIPIDLIVKKLAEDSEKVSKSAQKASEVLLGPLNTEIATTPHEIVYEEDRIRVKHYKPETGAKLKTPLLLVYALINRETMLDLQPGRSAIRNFLNEGVEIYMIDWGYPARKDRYLTIDDHVNGYINNVIDFIRERHNLSKINLMGICMGGTFSVMYSALHPEKIKNLVTTVTPVNFDTDTGLLHVWMKSINVDKMVDTHGNIPADMMNFGFLLLNPARLMIDKYVGFLQNVNNKNFVENFIRMEKWIFDSPDIPGETFRQFINDCYKKNLLIQNKMELGGHRVDLKKITMPLFNIYGKFDHLVPPEACERTTKAVGSRDTEDVRLDTGHIGIYVSSKVQKEFAPRISNWLKERDKPEKESPGRKKPVARRTVTKTRATVPLPKKEKKKTSAQGDTKND